jgi:hypothetical protein
VAAQSEDDAESDGVRPLTGANGGDFTTLMEPISRAAPE